MLFGRVGRALRRVVENRHALAYFTALFVCLVAGTIGTTGSGEIGFLDALPQILPLVVGSVSAAAGVAWLGSRLGHRPRIAGAVAAGFAFSLLLSPGTAVVPAVIAMAFGWIVSQEVFGKREHSFVHPSVLAYVFLALTWPQALGEAREWLPAGDLAAASWSDLLMLPKRGGGLGASSALACGLAALLLLAVRRIPWRILVSVPVGMAVGLGVLGSSAAPGLPLGLHAHWLLGNVFFGVVFLATDSASSPTSKSGRWAFGVVIGFLIVLQRLAKTTSPDGTLFAILVASVFAPLLDRVAEAGHAKWSGKKIG